MPSPLTVQPSTKDNYLNEGSANTNYGTSISIGVRDQLNITYRCPIEFDISAIPAGQQIDVATLQLYYVDYSANGYIDPVGKTVWAYKLSRTDWVEDESTWNIYKTGSNWTAAGGDYVTSSPSGGSTVFPAGYGWMSWNVLAIVRDAYPAAVVEFLVKLATEGLSSNYSRAWWRSNDFAPYDPTLCPKLYIEYSAVAPVVGRSRGFIIG